MFEFEKDDCKKYGLPSTAAAFKSIKYFSDV